MMLLLILMNAMNPYIDSVSVSRVQQKLLNCLSRMLTQLNAGHERIIFCLCCVDPTVCVN